MPIQASGKYVPSVIHEQLLQDEKFVKRDHVQIQTNRSSIHRGYGACTHCRTAQWATISQALMKQRVERDAL